MILRFNLFVSKKHTAKLMRMHTMEMQDLSAQRIATVRGESPKDIKRCNSYSLTFAARTFDVIGAR